MTEVPVTNILAQEFVEELRQALPEFTIGGGFIEGIAFRDDRVRIYRDERLVCTLVMLPDGIRVDWGNSWTVEHPTCPVEGVTLLRYEEPELMEQILREIAIADTGADIVLQMLQEGSHPVLEQPPDDAELYPTMTVTVPEGGSAALGFATIGVMLAVLWGIWRLLMGWLA